MKIWKESQQTQKLLLSNFWAFTSIHFYHLNIIFLPFLVKNILTPSALKSVYYSLLHSHFIYGIQIWCSTSDTNFNCLYIKQKSAIRIINSAKYNSHSIRYSKSPESCHCQNWSIFFSYSFFITMLSTNFHHLLQICGRETKKEDKIKLF